MTVTLGPLLSCHLDQLREWRNSPEVRRHVRETRYLTDEDQRRWWEWLHDDKGRTIRMFGVFNEKLKRQSTGTYLDLVGCVGLTSIDWINRSAELSVYTVPTEHEPVALEALLDHAFQVLGLHRVYAETITQERADLCAQFMYDEGVSREAYWRAGWVDARQWALLAESWYRK